MSCLPLKVALLASNAVTLACLIAAVAVGSVAGCAPVAASIATTVLWGVFSVLLLVRLHMDDANDAAAALREDAPYDQKRTTTQTVVVIGAAIIYLLGVIVTVAMMVVGTDRAACLFEACDDCPALVLPLASVAPLVGGFVAAAIACVRQHVPVH